ncbi:MAG: polysaccharide biosynthesis protein [Lachnospiraceae bacterium]|nr:polysaccharide biosynthesis protein [Lachnospiraceae bacterium]
MAKSTNNNNYLVQGTILAFSSIVSRFIGMLYRVPLTNIIGDTGMGYYSSAYELYNLALILSSYSIPVAVSKLVSGMESQKQYRNAHRVFLTALKIAAAVGLLAAAAVYLLADAWAKLVHNLPVAIPLRVLAPTIFVFAVMGVFRGYFQGKRTMVPTALSQLVEQIVHAVVSVAAAYQLMQLHNASVDMEAYGAAGGTLGALVGAVVAFLMLLGIYGMNYSFIQKKVRKDRTGVSDSTAEISRLFVMTVVPIILSQTVYQLSGTIDNAVFGQIMVFQGKSEEETSLLWGIYANKYRMLTNLPVAIATALGTSIVPALANTWAVGDDDEVREKIASSVRFNMLLAIPSAVGLGVLAEPVISLLFRSTEIELSARLLVVGSVAVVFFAYSTLTNGILQGINKMKLPVYHAAISLVLHVACLALMLMVFRLDAYGLVLGNVLYAFCVCVLNWRAIAKYADYRQEFRNTFLMPALCAAVMGAVAYLVYHGLYQATRHNTISVILAMSVAVLCYALLLVVTRTVSEEELLGFPKGTALVRLLRRTRLLH